MIVHLSHLQFVNYLVSPQAEANAPIVAAVMAVYAFIKEWQVLIAGVLLMAGAKLLATAIVEAAQIRAGAGHGASQPGSTTLDVRPRHIEQPKRPAFGTRARTARRASPGVAAASPPTPIVRLETLRSATRSAIAALSPTKVIDQAAVQTCSRVSALSFQDLMDGKDENTGRFKVLQAELVSLQERAVLGADAKDAMALLMRVYTLAGDLLIHVSPDGPEKNANMPLFEKAP